MRISIESNHHEVNDQLVDMIKTKVGKLEHYYENIVDAIVFLHDSPNYREVEIKLNVPSDTLFAREQGDNFQAALDMSVEKMKRQITKYKETTLKK